MNRLKYKKIFAHECISIPFNNNKNFAKIHLFRKLNNG